jgi:Na+/H+-dicarboxylate symporter
MQYDGILEQIVQVACPLIALIIIVSFLYLLFLFSVASNFDFKVFSKYIKSILPVALMGFSTMSSLATMPITLKVAEKNTGNAEVASLTIPITSNVHLLGDCIAIPLVALSLLLSFGNEFPSFTTYSTFAICFAFAKFSVAAVPGGGILVMLPVLDKYLGFSGEMLNIITTLYMVFDPIVTVINVLGNSVLVILISKLFKKVEKTAIPAT